MFYSLRKLFVFTLMAFSFQVSAAEPLRIHDKGLDGNDRIFVVNCPNGDRSSVAVTYEFGQKVSVAKVCVFPAYSQMTCRNGFWNVDEAAEFSCK